MIALDQWSNQATTYAGAIHFSSTDFRAQLPDDSTFSPDEDFGVHGFTVTLRTSGSQRIAVADVDNPLLRGEVTVDVADGSAPSGSPANFWALLLWEPDAGGWHLRRM